MSVTDEDLQDLVDEMDRGRARWISGQVDLTADGVVRQAEDILEQDPPLLPVAWEKINDGWYNYVKGHNPYHYFGIYDVVRWDTAWLDK